MDNGDYIIPLEVKAEINLKAKSLKTYREKSNPEIRYFVHMYVFCRQNGTGYTIDYADIAGDGAFL